MKDADRPRSENRARINKLFNGDPPYEESEAEQNHIETNVNDLAGPHLLHQARNQFTNAFSKPGDFFKVSIDGGPPHKRSEWSGFITKHINKTMKKHLPHMESQRSVFAQVCLHGIGPRMWENRDYWCADMVGIEDLLAPSGTRVSLDNVEHFANFIKWTPGKLYRRTHGNKVDPGWNMEVVSEQLKKLLKEEPGSSNDDLVWNPEKAAEKMRADGGYYESDAVPTLKAWNFYYREEESDEEEWHRCIVLDGEVGGSTGSPGKFLYKSKRNYGNKLSELLHIQFADGSNVAPFLYHSVRSLGFLLYSVCHLQNRLHCKFNDAVFESMLWYFRNVSAEDRERLESVELHHLGIIPEGLNFVPGNERFQVNEALVGAAFNRNRQIMSENSASYVQDVNDTNRDTEETATKTMARVNQAAALVGAMLSQAYAYETHYYHEVARRFCKADSRDPDVKKFRERCMADGVPEEMLDVERWNIEPERVLGQGNKTLELVQAERLMAVRNLHDGDAQREILHIYDQATTDDPGLAERLVPMKKPEMNDAIYFAQLAAGTLMAGMKVGMKEGINHIDYVEAMMISMATKIGQIEQTGAMATKEEVIGLQNMATHIQEHIDKIAEDPNEKARVKDYGDKLGKMLNMVKAYAQRLQEQQGQQQNQLPPEAQAKIVSSGILAQSAAKIKEGKSAQQLAHKEQAFRADQSRKEREHQLDMARSIQDVKVETVAKDLSTAAEIAREKKKADEAPKKKETA